MRTSSQYSRSDWNRTWSASNHFNVELSEFYTDIDMGLWQLRLGKQQIVWGQADGLKVLDVINPQTYREFILDRFDDSRIAQWSLNFEKELPKDRSLQILAVLDNTHNEIMNPGAEFAFQSSIHLKNSGLRVLETERGSGALKQAKFGVKYSQFRNAWDLSYHYLNFQDHNPVMFQKMGFHQKLIAPKYERSHLLGMSASTSKGDITLRFETAYLRDVFYASDGFLGVEKSSELKAVIGVDWSKFENTLLSMQVFQSYVLKDADQMFRDQVESKISFLMKKNFKNETLQLELFYLYSINDGDGLFRPKISYELQDNQKLSLSLDLFHGDLQELFGQFRSKDRVNLSYEIGF